MKLHPQQAASPFLDLSCAINLKSSSLIWILNVILRELSLLYGVECRSKARGEIYDTTASDTGKIHLSQAGVANGSIVGGVHGSSPPTCKSQRQTMERSYRRRPRPDGVSDSLTRFSVFVAFQSAQRCVSIDQSSSRTQSTSRNNELPRWKKVS